MTEATNGSGATPADPADVRAGVLALSRAAGDAAIAVARVADLRRALVDGTAPSGALGDLEDARRHAVKRLGSAAAAAAEVGYEIPAPWGLKGPSFKTMLDLIGAGAEDRAHNEFLVVTLRVVEDLCVGQLRLGDAQAGRSRAAGPPRAEERASTPVADPVPTVEASKSPHEDPGQRRGAQKAWAELEGFLYERWEDGSVTKTECSRKALKAGFAGYMGERQPAAGVPPNLEWTPCGAEQAAPRVADSGADAAPPPRASLLEEGAQRARELFRRALARWSR